MVTNNNSTGKGLEDKLLMGGGLEKGPENLDLNKMGETLVREDRAELWKKYIAKNTQDPYSKAIVEGVYLVMKALSEGETPEMSLKSTKGLELTLFMTGNVAYAVSEFSNRGEEFAKYWNSLYLSESENAEGVVNPAIWHIK